jgi:hypothetical protein
MLQRLHRWHQTKPGFLVFGVAELAAAYGFASLAIDRGNLWYYALTLLLLVGVLQNCVKLIGGIFHGTRTKR